MVISPVDWGRTGILPAHRGSAHPPSVPRIEKADRARGVLGDGLWTSSSVFTELPQYSREISTDSAQPLERGRPVMSPPLSGQDTRTPGVLPPTGRPGDRQAPLLIRTMRSVTWL